MSFRAKYNMRADVYEQAMVVQPSGQRQREWNYRHPVLTIECIARGLGSDGLRSVGSTERYSGSDFEDVEWVRLKSAIPLDKRHRVGRIGTVNRWGEFDLHWRDFEGEPVIFEVIGVNATQDPFGRKLEYEVLAKKVVDK